MAQDFAMQPQLDNPERARQIQHAFFDAVAELNLPRAERLLHAGADINAIDQRDPLEGARLFTPLMYATVSQLHGAEPQKAAQMADFLLTNQADPNIGDHLGNRPLHWAANRANGAMVHKLLAHGADSRLQNMDGDTAADLAREFNLNKRNGPAQDRHAVAAKQTHLTLAQALDAHSERLTLAERLPVAQVQDTPRRRARL